MQKTVQPVVQQAQNVEIDIEDREDENVTVAVVAPVCVGDVEMTPAGNPFGAPSGAPSSSPFAQQPAAQKPAMATPFGASSPFTSASPFGNAAPATPTPTPGLAANPFGQPSMAASAITSTSFGAPSVPLSNTSTSPFTSISNQAARQPSPNPIANPFAPSPKTQAAASSTPAAPATSSPFGIFANSLSDSAQIGVTKPNPFEALKNTSKDTFTTQLSGAPPKPNNPFDAFKNPNPNQAKPAPPAVSGPPFGGQPKKAVHFADNVQSRTIPAAAKMGDSRFAPQPSEGTQKLSPLAVDYAQKVHSQLRTDGIKAPRWPLDPGNPAQRPAMERLKESYKKYRASAYVSLRKAEIIDDPDRKRRLEDALTFKGICEDMCPDYEQVTRICEYDVKKEEKRPAPTGGDPWPEPSKMVKKFSRSAAGIEEPLPMDVRSFDALKRSTDYLLGELLRTDDQLPSLHGYLWDRTRAVRKDFSFHSHKTSEEMQVMVYILETIARFHVVSLHLLSRKGVASDDFDQQQEVQQLGATLLSLNETYDDCRPRNLVCENEGEFRALYLLLNMHDTSVVEKSLEWASQPWYDSTHMENAKSLLAALQSFDQVAGPFNPRSLGSHFAASGFTKFFDLVGSKAVSYTMACMCEIHFTWLRQRILQTLVKGFARRRDWPKDITPRILNRMLRFDTDEEAVEFVKLHDFEFETRRVDGRQERFLLLKSKRQHVPSPRVSQSHSATMVEAKRNGQPLAEVFRKSIYGDKDIEFSNDGDSEIRNVLPDNTADNADSDDGDDMFVGQSRSAQSNGKQLPAQQTKSPFGAPSVSSFTAKTSPFASNTPSFGASTTPSAPNASPFAAKAPSPFAPATASSSNAQPANGVPQNGTTTAPASQPAAPSASPFTQGSGKPFINPFASLTPAAQQPAVNNGPSIPAAQPAKASGASGFSFLGAAQNKTPATSVSADVSKAGSPATGFAATGGSQKSTPNATTTPSTVDKETSVFDAKTSTPQSSVFSSLASNKSTPPTGGFFPTSTPAGPSSSSVQPPSATSTTPATSIFSAASSAKDSKTTPSAPSTTSVLAQPTAATSSTSATPASQPQQPRTSQLPGSTSAPNVQQPLPAQTTATPAAPPPSPAPPAKPADPMADFTKWFVTGDGGLLEEFTEFTVENLVEETFAKFQAEEAERIRKEEDEASWAAARKHMAYNLSVKYFYRWQRAARERAMRRVLREGKAKYRAAMEASAQAKREKKLAEKKAAERERREREERLRNFSGADELERIIAETRRSRQSSAEEALLASGVFAGVRDERLAARRVVEGKPHRVPSSSSSLRQESGRSIMAPPPPTQQQQVQPQDVTPAKREGWKTRSLREKLNLPRRDSFSSTTTGGTSGNNNFSQSLPVGGSGRKAAKVTNFSAAASTSSSRNRKRSATESSDDEPEAKKSKILKSGYSLHWELRRRGLAQMPDGQWLPQRIATQMYEGKRFAGYGDCGLGPGKKVDDVENKDGLGKKQEEGNVKKDKQQPASNGSSSLRESKLEALARRFGFPPTRSYRRDSLASASRSGSYNVASSSPLQSSSSPGGGKRKRDDDAGSPTAAKKVYVIDSSSGSEEDEESSAGSKEKGKTTTAAGKVERALARMRRQIRELNENMDVLEAEDKPWMREQTRRLARGQRGGDLGGGGYGGLSGGVRDEGGL